LTRTTTHFSVGDLDAGLFELYAKAPIEKWQKSQEVDTESVYFFASRKIKKCTQKRPPGSTWAGAAVKHQWVQKASLILFYHRRQAVGKPIILWWNTSVSQFEIGRFSTPLRTLEA
jgi:hypothetical protein